MIIDAHTHIHPDPHGFGERYNYSLKKLIESLVRSPVEKAILLPLFPEVSNKFIAESCKKFPDKLIGFASLDPLDENASETLESDITRLHLKGLKLHPRRQNFELTDSRIIPVFEKCAELSIPVVIDAFPGTTKSDGSSVPVQIGKMADTVPDVRMIIAHAGGYKILDSLFVAKNHKNIYLDLSYSLNYFLSSSVEQDIGFVVRKLGADRCIYGSDHPEMALDITYVQSVNLLKKFRFNDDEITYIFGGTIESLLG